MDDAPHELRALHAIPVILLPVQPLPLLIEHLKVVQPALQLLRQISLESPLINFYRVLVNSGLTHLICRELPSRNTILQELPALLSSHLCRSGLQFTIVAASPMGLQSFITKYLGPLSSPTSYALTLCQWVHVKDVSLHYVGIKGFA